MAPTHETDKAFIFLGCSFLQVGLHAVPVSNNAEATKTEDPISKLNT